jgi:5-methylphenazine-1-carboxylate 1-monooxygenase
MRVIVIGGGIGGLTAALCLQRQGHEVDVHEAVAEPKPLGVGTNLLPNGAEVLHRLGLGRRLDQTGIRTRAIEYRTRYGHVLASDPRGVDAGFAFPQYSIHRGELLLILLETALERIGPDHIHLGQRFDRFEQGADRVTAFFSSPDGQPAGSASGAVMVGADGFHSAVRHQLHPDEGPAHFEGIMLFRGTSEQAPFGDGRTMFIAGNHDLKLVCYPISEAARRRGRSLINFVAELRSDRPRSAKEADWNRVGSRDFIERFDEFSMPDIDVVGLLEGAGEILEYPMIDRDPLPWWTDGRVTLLGDAAHPMYPIGANGASQAIRDALALEQTLTGSSGALAALAAYEDERRELTAKVVLANGSTALSEFSTSPTLD